MTQQASTKATERAHSPEEKFAIRPSHVTMDHNADTTTIIRRGGGARGYNKSCTWASHPSPPLSPMHHPPVRRMVTNKEGEHGDHRHMGRRVGV